MKNFTIEECTPGMVVVKNGVRYIVVKDSPSEDIVGQLLNCRTGELTHWTCVFTWNEIVEIGS